jgi:hypothetical protein
MLYLPGFDGRAVPDVTGRKSLLWSISNYGFESRKKVPQLFGLQRSEHLAIA